MQYCRTVLQLLNSIYIIILNPDERRPTTVRSNDTLVSTPFQLISDVNKVLSVLSMLSKLPPGVCWKGGPTGLLNKGGGSNSNRLPGLVTKQQAVEFPQVQTSTLRLRYRDAPLHWTVLINEPLKVVRTNH